MKATFILVLLFWFGAASAQSGMISFRVVATDSLDNDLIDVTISTGSKTVLSGTHVIGEDFIVDSLEAGKYYIRISKVGRREVAFKYLDLKPGEFADIIMHYPDSCRFDYPKGFKPVCPKGHKDEIVPIIYGFPLDKERRKAERGKIYLGGCIISGCDPGYYCKIHKEMF